MAVQQHAAGSAALSICEALLIALVEKGVLSLEEAQAALEDAAAAHQGAEGVAHDAQFHHLVVQIVERLIVQLNAADSADSRPLRGP
ncbi:hypothetical protein [Azospirillum canadense]|uniref:hypothetical protein n=1 Tax=Azospirillum canadense TaxID=403962 RepID=UPI0022271CE9|nr:hypothetical protein [Azospirillum canadense]MCW2236662.1 uncharacterized protein YjiK [Azospirillum canadense]